MNKQHSYRGYTFNIKVELNNRIEKRIDGKREHKITLNDMGVSNYYQTMFCETKGLGVVIHSMTREAEVWVDKQLDGDKSEEVLLLESLGFK